MPLLCRNLLTLGLRNERQTARKKKEMGRAVRKGADSCRQAGKSGETKTRRTVGDTAGGRLKSLEDTGLGIELTTSSMIARQGGGRQWESETGVVLLSETMKFTYGGRGDSRANGRPQLPPVSPSGSFDPAFHLYTHTEMTFIWSHNGWSNGLGYLEDNSQSHLDGEQTQGLSGWSYSRPLYYLYTTTQGPKKAAPHSDFSRQRAPLSNGAQTWCQSVIVRFQSSPVWARDHLIHRRRRNKTEKQTCFQTRQTQHSKGVTSLKQAAVYMTINSIPSALIQLKAFVWVIIIDGLAGSA